MFCHDDKDMIRALEETNGMRAARWDTSNRSLAKCRGIDHFEHATENLTKPFLGGGLRDEDSIQ